MKAGELVHTDSEVQTPQPLGFEASVMGREQREKSSTLEHGCTQARGTVGLWRSLKQSVPFTAGFTCEDEEMESKQKSSVHECRRTLY